MKKSFRLLLLSAFALTAFNAAAADDPTDALPWSRIDHNPVTLGMGTAGFADTDNAAWASFRNAALTPLTAGSFSAAASWARWMPSSDDGALNHINAGAAYRFGRMGVALGVSYMPGKEYEVFNLTGASEGKYTPKDLQLNAGFGYALTEALSLGANVRYLSSSLTADDSYTSLAGDIAAVYNLGSATVAAGLSNIGTAIEDAAGNKYSIPTSVSLGSTWHAAFEGVHAVKASLDADYFFSGELTAALGAQYSYDNLVFVRAGYHVASEHAVLPSFLTLGLGVSYAGFSLDAAYITANEALGNTLTLGLKYQF